MIVGAAIIPSAPMLVPGVMATVPDDVAAVADAIDAVLDRLPDAEATVLVTAGRRGAAGSVRDSDTVSLAGIGRPDIVADVLILPAGVARVSTASQYPLVPREPLPLDAAVLALLVGTDRPLVPVVVPPMAEFQALVGIGAGIAQVMAELEVPALVVAAGDLSAGLSGRSPLAEVAGARDWDDAAVAAIDSGRLDGLGRLGPAEAARVGARGWAAMAVLHGACARAKIGMVVRHYSAPAGVGYVVAVGR